MTEPSEQGLLCALGFCQPLGDARVLCIAVLLPKDFSMDRKELI